MGHPENGLETVIVYNGKAGDRWPDHPEEMIRRTWPGFKILKFGEVIQTPNLVYDKNIVGLGGDESHGWLSELCREGSENSIYFPLALGTVCALPNSLGMGRKSNFPESTDNYLKRMYKYWLNNQFQILTISPGIVQLSDRFIYFPWIAGAGASVKTLSGIEAARKAGYKMTGRLVSGMQQYFRQVAIYDQVVETKISGNEITAWDVNVVNSPFNYFSYLKLSDRQSHVLFISRPEDKNDRNRKICLAGLDAILMVLGHKTSGLGLVEQRLQPGEQVEIYNSNRHFQINSGIRRLSKDINVSVSVESVKPYRISALI